MNQIVADACVRARTVAALRSSGLTVQYVKELGPRIGDEDVLAIAAQQGLLLVTVDLGFGDLIFHRLLRTAGVLLLRLPGWEPGEIADRVLEELRAPNPLLGYFTVIRPNGVRRRPLPDYPITQ